MQDTLDVLYVRLCAATFQRELNDNLAIDLFQTKQVFILHHLPRRLRNLPLHSPRFVQHQHWVI